MNEPMDPFGGFEEMEDDGLDIDAIFGTADNSVPPEPIPQVPQAAQKELGRKAVSDDEGQMVKECRQEKTPESQPKAENGAAEMGLFAAFMQGGEAGVPEAPSEGTATSLFDKPPMFSYGGAKEEILDASITFEDLRLKKAEDFPELEDAKTVSWRVKYGDVTKFIPSPKQTEIAAIKAEIEKSKDFLNGLKKGKVKDPACLVTPTVTAKSKGIVGYKGVFPSAEAARASDKVICLIPARDGQTYELRRTEMGEFIAPKNNIVDFEEVKAGFYPALPRIPQYLMGQIIAFFRSFMSETDEAEALVQIYWDRCDKKFTVFVPRQKASKAYLEADVQDGAPDEERYLCYCDCHSHNSMEAHFSCVDDRDERATRLYLVIGRLNRFYPSVSARVSCGGRFLEIDPAIVLEPVDEIFPDEWTQQVSLATVACPPTRNCDRYQWKASLPAMKGRCRL